MSHLGLSGMTFNYRTLTVSMAIGFTSFENADHLCSSHVVTVIAVQCQVFVSVGIFHGSEVI